MNRPALPNTFKPVEMLPFELYRRDAVSIRVAALWVAEHVEMVEDISARRFAIGVDPTTRCARA